MWGFARRKKNDVLLLELVPCRLLPLGELEPRAFINIPVSGDRKPARSFTEASEHETKRLVDVLVVGPASDENASVVRYR